MAERRLGSASKSISQIIDECQERLNRAVEEMRQHFGDTSGTGSSLGVMSDFDDSFTGAQVGSGSGGDSSLGILSNLDDSLSGAQDFLQDSSGGTSSLGVVSDLDDSLSRALAALSPGDSSIPPHIFPSPGAGQQVPNLHGIMDRIDTIVDLIEDTIAQQSEDSSLEIIDDLDDLMGSAGPSDLEFTDFRSRTEEDFTSFLSTPRAGVPQVRESPSPPLPVYFPTPAYKLPPKPEGPRKTPASKLRPPTAGPSRRADVPAPPVETPAETPSRRSVYFAESDTVFIVDRLSPSYFQISDEGTPEYDWSDSSSSPSPSPSPERPPPRPVAAQPAYRPTPRPPVSPARQPQRVRKTSPQPSTSTAPPPRYTHPDQPLAATSSTMSLTTIDQTPGGSTRKTVTFTERTIPPPRQLKPPVQYTHGPGVYGSTRPPPLTPASHFDHPRATSTPIRPPSPGRPGPSQQPRTASAPQRPPVVSTPRPTGIPSLGTPTGRPLSGIGRPASRAIPGPSTGRPVSAEGRSRPVQARPETTQPTPGPSRIPGPGQTRPVPSRIPGPSRLPAPSRIPSPSQPRSTAAQPGPSRPPPTSATTRSIPQPRYTRQPPPDPTRYEMDVPESFDVLEMRVFDVEDRIKRIEADIFSPIEYVPDRGHSTMSPQLRDKFMDSFSRIKQGVSRLQEMVDRRIAERSFEKQRPSRRMDPMGHYSI